MNTSKYADSTPKILINIVIAIAALVGCVR